MRLRQAAPSAAHKKSNIWSQGHADNNGEQNETKVHREIKTLNI